MKVVFLRTLPDGRGVLIYDNGKDRNNMILIVSSNRPIPDKIITFKDSWSWEEQLPKILGVSKKELGLNER